MLEYKTCPRCGRNNMLPWQKVCSSCTHDNYRIKVKQEITSGDGETDNEEEVYCPHCGEVITQEDTDCNIFFEEGEEEIDCPHCGKQFHLKTTVEYRYSTSRELEW